MGLTVPSRLVLALIVQAVVGLIAPPFLAFYVDRRLKAGWRWIWYGAVVFLILEIVTFIIGVVAGAFLVRFLGPPALRPPTSVGVIRALRLAAIAGIFEEAGRYTGYRLFFRPGERDWSRGVMYGLGHGGFEAMFDKTLRSMFGVSILVFLPRLRPGDCGLTREKLAPLVVAFKKLAAIQAWEPLLGAVARIGVIGFHLCFATIVLQVFRHGSLAWLFYAIALHIVVDASVGVAAVYSLWASDLLSMGWAIVSMIVVLRLRESATPTVSPAHAEPLEVFNPLLSEESR